MKKESCKSIQQNMKKIFCPLHMLYIASTIAGVCLV